MARADARGATVASCTRSRAETPRRKPTISLPGITTDACGAGTTAAWRTPAVARPPAPDTTTASTTTEAATRRPRAMLPRYVCNPGVAILTWGIVSRSVEDGEYRVLRSGDRERPR